MKISARNQFQGKVLAVEHGAINATVKVDIGNGHVVTSSITNDAVDDLALSIGDAVTVLIKSSDVLLGK